MTLFTKTLVGLTLAGIIIGAVFLSHALRIEDMRSVGIWMGVVALSAFSFVLNVTSWNDLKAILNHVLLIAFYLAMSLFCGWLWARVWRCMFVPGAVGTFLLLSCVYVGARADRGNDDKNQNPKA